MMFPEVFVELWLFLILVEDRSGVTVVKRSLFCLGGLDLEESATDYRSRSARFWTTNLFRKIGTPHAFARIKPLLSFFSDGLNKFSVEHLNSRTAP